MSPRGPRRAGGPAFPLAGVPAFGAIWAGQLVSLFGSRLSAFGVSVWVFQETGSATRFAFIALVATVPALLLGPVAGAVADRFDRRRVMLAGDVGAAVSTVVLFVLFAGGAVQLWHLYLLVAANAACSVFQAPAFNAAVTTLVPRRQFGRAGGMLGLAPALVNLGAPPLAGLLLSRAGMEQILLFDLATFGVAILSLWMVAVPAPEGSAGDRPDDSLGRRIVLGWRFIAERPALGALLGYQALIHALVTALGVLLVPMVLGFASPSVAGTVLSAGGAGMLAGSLLMTFGGGWKRRVHGVLGAGLLFGVSLALVGARPSAVAVGVAMFGALLAFPLIRAHAQVIWRLKVPEAAQGRVFALRTTLLDATQPVVLLAVGPLADRVFEPLMRPGGGLAEVVGRVMGTGPGRGIAVLFVLLGLSHVAATAGFLRIAALRRVETDLPDAAGRDEPRVPAAPGLAVPKAGSPAG